MKDLTDGPIARNILQMSVPIAAGMFFQTLYIMVVMGSALRGTGIVQPTMVVQVLTVVLNAVLAPVLIAGWGTGHPLGVAGAGLASSIAVAVGVVLLALYFRRLEKYVVYDPAGWRPQLATWARLLRIGLPAGGEFALMFLFMAVMYWITGRFGSAAQAGYGIGSRLMQASPCFVSGARNGSCARSPTTTLRWPWAENFCGLFR